MRSTLATEQHNEQFCRNTKALVGLPAQNEAWKSNLIVSKVQAIHLIPVFHCIWCFSHYVCFCCCCCFYLFILLAPILPAAITLQVGFKQNVTQILFVLLLPDLIKQQNKYSQILTGSVRIRKYPSMGV